MALFGWGKKKKGGSSEEEQRMAEERLRWKSVIAQQGTPGTGGTEEERAEAARLRRAALVAQDPTYVTRRLGAEEQPSMEQDADAAQEVQQGEVGGAEAAAGLETCEDASVQGAEVRIVAGSEQQKVVPVPASVSRESMEEARSDEWGDEGGGDEGERQGEAQGLNLGEAEGTTPGPASPSRVAKGTKDTWYQSPAYSRLKQRFDQQGINESPVSPTLAANGGWGELPEEETPEEAAQRAARQQKLREDASRTLGDRAKYFKDQEPKLSDAVTPRGEVRAEESVAMPPKRKEEAKGGLYRRGWKEAADRKLANILGVKKSDVEAKYQQEAAKQQQQLKQQQQQQEQQQQELKQQQQQQQRQGQEGGGATKASGYLPRFGADKVRVGGVEEDWEVEMEDLPVIGEEEEEVGEARNSVWKVIAQDDVVVLAGPRDGEKPIGRVRKRQSVEVDREALPWVRLANVEGWVRVSGGKRGREIFLVRQGKTLGFDDVEMERKWGKQSH